MSLSPIGSASDIQMDYMKLLVTQLQNQNPLEPIDNNDMAAQLAQFSQLQQLEMMNTRLDTANSNFGDILSSAQSSYANSLIGRDVSFLTESETGDVLQFSGEVKEVVNDPSEGNTLIIEVGSQVYSLGLDGIISIRD